MNVWFWALFPFICVFLVFTLVGAARFIRWCKTRHEWSQHVRTQRTVFEQEEYELLTENVINKPFEEVWGDYEVDDED